MYIYIYIYIDKRYYIYTAYSIIDTSVSLRSIHLRAPVLARRKHHEGDDRRSPGGNAVGRAVGSPIAIPIKGEMNWWLSGNNIIYANIPKLVVQSY